MALFNRRYAGVYKNLSETELGFFTREGRLKQWMRYLARYDVATLYHEFGDISVANLGWAVANSSGTGAANFALPSTKVANGGATMESGTDDNGSASAIHHLTWLGDQNCGIMAALKVDVVTGYNLEFGFIDAVPGSNNGGVSDVDTPTANMTDGALFTIDTDQTITTLATVTAGAGGFTTTATTLASPAITNLTAATYATFMIQLVGNSAFFYLNGVLCASHTGNKVEGGTLLAPWLYIRTRNTTEKIVTADYVFAWQDRR